MGVFLVAMQLYSVVYPFTHPHSRLLLQYAVITITCHWVQEERAAEVNAALLTFLQGL